MADLSIHADRRTVTGKKVSSLRRQGIIPANLYGPGIASENLQVDAKALASLIQRATAADIITLEVGEANRRSSVMFRGARRDPNTGHLLHADFYQPSLTHVLTAEIHVVFTGDSPAAHRGGMLAPNLTSLHVQGLPDKLPHRIEVDVSVLKELGQMIRVRDLKPIEGIAFLDEGEESIVKVVRTAAEESVKVASPAAEEPAKPTPTPTE